MSNRTFNSYDALKLFALLAMTVDHVGNFLLPHAMELRVIGRFAAPIFCFLVGWNGRYDFKRGLLIAAIIASACDVYFHALLPLNILWTILFGRMVLEFLEKRAKPESPMVLAAASVIWIGSFAAVEYGTLALLWMLWGRAAQRQPNGSASWVYGIVGCAVGAAFMMVLTDYTALWQYIATGFVFVLLLFWLQKFELREYPKAPAVAMVLARNSMEYYVLHRAAIFAIGIAIGTVTPGFKLLLGS